MVSEVNEPIRQNQIHLSRVKNVLVRIVSGMRHGDSAPYAEYQVEELLSEQIYWMKEVDIDVRSFNEMEVIAWVADQ